MNILESIVEYYDNLGEEILKADGLDEAVIGIEYSSGRLVYSKQKIIDILMSDGETSMEDALEHYDYNIAGGYVGELTPIWVDDMF